MQDTNNLNPSVLAFVGDAVYSLLVRKHLADINRRSKDLHTLAVEYVKAPAQAAAYKKIEPYLTEKETDIFKRGRNFHTNSSPKNAKLSDYHAATGLECLFGFLYLSCENERINELFEIIVKQ